MERKNVTTDLAKFIHTQRIIRRPLNPKCPSQLQVESLVVHLALVLKVGKGKKQLKQLKIFM